MSAPLTARMVAEFESAARAWPPSGAAAARRRAAIAALAAAGLPGTREENWRYANLRPLERQRFIAASVTPPAAPLALPPAVGYPRYVFVDGVFAPEASAPLAASRATLSVAAADTPVPAPQPAASAADERFALLNAAFGTAAAEIHVPAANGEPVCLELLFVASADAQSGASYPRLGLRLEPHSSLVLVERYLSAAAEPSFVASAVTVELGRGARLEHYRVQDLNTRSTLFDTLSAQLAAQASYRLNGIHTGAQAARSTLNVLLSGEGAELALAVAALGERAQVQDTFARVEHAAPRGRTQQTFRGIAAGRARVAFNGKIVVTPGAQGADSQQSLRGLLAGPEAEIDVRPQLEIYTDEVRCSHGATAGKLDEDMLFYLLSRGLAPESAQRLLKWAFLEDVVAQIRLPALRREIEQHLAGQLRDEALQEIF